MTQALSVEYQELITRAGELERPWPRVPSANPQAPCRLKFVDDTAVQLALSANAMRLYLQAGEREWKKLAKSLRNAAKAYETVDEGSSAAISSIDFDGSGARSKTAGSDQMSVMCDPDEDFGGYLPPPPPPPPPFQYPYYEVRTAATLIVTGDGGAAYKQFAAEWDAFQRAFQAETERFRPFISWEGVSQIAVTANFNAQRQWIYTMAGFCRDLHDQALRVVSAHKNAAVHGQHRSWSSGNPTTPTEHPTTYEVSQCDYWYEFYTRRNSPYLYTAIEWYEELQEASETSLQLYVAGGIPLPPVIPTAPTAAHPIAEPIPKPDPEKPGDSDDPDNPGGDIPNPDLPSGGGDSPSEEDPLNDYLNDPSLTETPMMPSTGMGGMPSMPSGQNDPKLTEALNRLGKAPGGVKPASVGAGGAGGVGAPKMPLAEAPGAGGAAGAGAGKPPLIGGAIPGVRGSGGAMGGGMPMGGAPGGHGKDGKQGKRIASSEDEALYTEDREWTGSVIGHRRTVDGSGDQ